MKKFIFILSIILLLTSCSSNTTKETIHEHKYEIEDVVDATCASKGYTVYVCSCGDKYNDSYTEMLPHNPVIDERFEPTDLEDGLTEGSHCSNCGVVIVEQKVIPANIIGTDLITNLLKLEEDTLKATLSNDTSTFSIKNDIYVSKNASYVLSTDQDGLNVISPELVELLPGDNTFYLTIINGNDTRKLTVVLHRAQTFTVSFDTLGGSQIEELIVIENSLIDLPQAPSKTGYNFSSWDYDFSKPITCDTTITASYTLINYNIIYNLNGGTNSILNPSTYTIEDEVIFDYPTREFYEFTGWDRNRRIKVGTTGDITITASWNPYFTIDDGVITGVSKYVESLNDILIPERIDGVRIKSVADGVFENCTNAKTLEVSNSITSVSENAFSGLKVEKATVPASLCVYLDQTKIKEIIVTKGSIIERNSFTSNTLEKVELPNTITKISKYAFIGCHSLMTLTIPENVTTIEDDAFFECHNLIEIINLSKLNIEKGSNTFGSIGYYAENIFDSISDRREFKIVDNYYLVYDDKVLVKYLGNSENITIPSMVKIIGNYVFNNLGWIKKVSIPEGVTTIKDYAFASCKMLTTISIPNTVTSIGSYAFNLCSALDGVTLPNSLIELGSNAFYYCSSLSSINIPSGVSVIYKDTFNSCSKLTTVTLEEGLVEIDDGAFNRCSSLISLVIPKTVTIIGYETFAYCSSLSSILLQEGIQYIYSEAFLGCTSLTEMVIPNSVTYLEYSIFKGCTNLKNVTLSNKITMIGDSLFYNCKSLETITIPSDVKTIEENAFYRCTSLASISILGDIEYIGEQAFYSCELLKEIMVSDSLTKVGKNAFYNVCLTKATIPAIVLPYLNTRYMTEVVITSGTKINDEQFSQSTSLTSIILPNTITEIGRRAFYYCLKLKSIEIPSNVTKIEDGTFDCCVSLQTLVLPNSILEIGEKAFSSCEKLANISIPNSVTKIGNSAFSQCFSLKNIAIPGSVKSIGDYAFSYNDLETITLEEGIESIGWYAFFYNKSLTSITIPSTVTNITSNAFFQCNNLVTIYNKSNLVLEKGSTDNGSIAYYATEIYVWDSINEKWILSE